MTEPMHVDGNAVRGAFAGVLGFDVTTATLTCGKCCRTRAFAETSRLSPRARASWCAAGLRRRPGPASATRATCGSTSAAPSPGVYPLQDRWMGSAGRARRSRAHRRHRGRDAGGSAGIVVTARRS